MCCVLDCVSTTNLGQIHPTKKDKLSQLLKNIFKNSRIADRVPYAYDAVHSAEFVDRVNSYNMKFLLKYRDPESDLKLDLLDQISDRIGWDHENMLTE